MSARGAYCLLTPPDCTLRADALARFAGAAADGADCIYSDIERIRPAGEAKTVRRPDWSPDTLLSMNYLDGPLAVKRELAADLDANAMRSAAGRYATALLLTERARCIRHIPQALARCRTEPPCTDASVVSAALRRRRIRAQVEAGPRKGTFTVRYPVPVHTRVSCIVYGYAGSGSIRDTLESIACGSLWRHTELLAADNRPLHTQTERYYAALTQNRAAAVLRDPDETSVARLINRAAEQANGDVLLFLPAGTVLCRGNAISRMLEPALLSHVGAVGGASASDGVQSGILHNVRAFDGPMMVGTARFFQAGGLDETFAQRGAVRAFTLLNRDRRLYNVIVPDAAFRHAARETPPLSETNKLRLRDMRSFEPCTKQSL